MRGILLLTTALAIEACSSRGNSGRSRPEVLEQEAREEVECEVTGERVGILIAGGRQTQGTHLESVELWSPSHHCIIPPLPQTMWGHTVSCVKGKLMIYNGGSLYQLNGTSWSRVQHISRHPRLYHSASVIRDRILLAGGIQDSTTEMVQWKEER